MNVTVIIPAAGRSDRFGESDKLQQDLGGRPLLMRTVEAFAKRDEVRRILVAGPPDHIDAFRERFGPTLGFHGAEVVVGGRESRAATVKNAIASVAEDATHIAVHDAARPAVNQDLISRVFHAASTLRAVVPAISITSTVRRVEDQAVEVKDDEEDALAQSILGDAGRRSENAFLSIETIDRKGLMAVQTPQVFEAALLRRAYEQPLAGVTDDAMLVERLGESIHLIVGDATNFKVTTVDDLALVRAVLGIKPPAERPAHLRF